MYFSYFDESGDDGFPATTSPLFVLTAIYFHTSEWRNNYNTLRNFRVWTRDTYKIPMKVEMHTKGFLLNKNPYRQMNLSDDDRIAVIDKYCQEVCSLSLKMVNVVINKPIIRKADYNVLDNAFSYSIQRIDNDISDKSENFIIITDEGRLPKMRRTTRRIQVFNPIPSKFEGGAIRQSPIHRLLEDPLPKDSGNSYFIQVCDLVAFLVYNYMLLRVTKQGVASRMPPQVSSEKLAQWLDIIKPVLNLKASAGNEHGYGIVCYPKA